jgi:hypothetical protein
MQLRSPDLDQSRSLTLEAASLGYVIVQLGTIMINVVRIRSEAVSRN